MKVSEIKTLSQLKKAIENNKKLAKRLKKKNLYGSMSKKYKELNWDKPTFLTSQIRDCFDEQFYKCWRRLYIDKELKAYGKSYEAYYNKTNVQGLFLLKQIAAQTQQKYFNKSNKKKWKPKYIPYYFDSKYLGKCYICSYPQTMEWKAPLLTEFLQDKQYIFDQTNPYGRPLKELCQFIGKNLMNGKVQKWDFYFQRFLHEKR